jgi:hypothetical protein
MFDIRCWKARPLLRIRYGMFDVADSSYGERLEGYLAEKFIELVVGTDPEPLDDITLAIADSANV